MILLTGLVDALPYVGMTHRPSPASVQAKPPSPLFEARNIPLFTKLVLAAASAGHCEFRGCTTHLYRHEVSGLRVNLSENAHIYGFSEAGPRGNEPGRPTNINGADNLMLLCTPCHTTIDTKPSEFPVSLLQEMKHEHEERIRAVAAVGADAATCVIELKSNIAGDFVAIAPEQINAAIAPRYPVRRERVTIDLTKHADSPRAVALGCDEIEAEIHRLMKMEGRPHHVSVVGLAPIPLLVFLGATLGDKIAAELFQKHRDTGDWIWKRENPTAEFHAVELTRGTDPHRVAVVYSLSGLVPQSHLPSEIDETYSVYELRLASAEPNVSLLRHREDLTRARAANRELLGRIKARHDGLREIQIFPAVPAPFAIALGMDRHPKVDPALRIYDYNKNRSGFDSILTI